MATPRQTRRYLKRFLMLAAHDTTTSASTMAAYYLGNDYPLQPRLAAEVQQWPRELSFETVFHSVNVRHPRLEDHVRGCRAQLEVSLREQLRLPATKTLASK
jgi:cytochrome P450